MKQAREVALEALLQVEESEGYSNIVIDKALKSAALDHRDAALATTLFYGVLEKRVWLDYVLSRFSKIPLEKINRTVLEVLRIAVYQIFFLEKIPDSAAVNEAVNLVKKRGCGKASGFTNGMLRSVLRARVNLPEPDREKEPLLWKSVQYSCPEWLISLWEHSYGIECTEGILESLRKKPPIYVKVNTLLIKTEELRDRLQKTGVSAELAVGVPEALCLETPGPLQQVYGFEEGLFHVQDLSSQLCCFLIAPQPGETVVDTCAAPGGKSFTIAEWMHDTGVVYSYDKYKGKVGLIRSGAERLRLKSVQAGVRDALAGTDQTLQADAVLCDAPCSGLGIIRRKPEIRYKKPESLDSLPDLQYRILDSSSALCKPGGRLFYSTCTLNPAENGGVADRFLANHPEFEPLELRMPDGMPDIREHGGNQITLFPHVHGTDGFFISAFRRKR